MRLERTGTGQKLCVCVWSYKESRGCVVHTRVIGGLYKVSLTFVPLFVRQDDSHNLFKPDNRCCRQHCYFTKSKI